MVCKAVDLHKYSAAARDEALSELEIPRPCAYFLLEDIVDPEIEEEDANILRSKWQEILARKLAQCRDEFLIQKELSHVRSS